MKNKKAVLWNTRDDVEATREYVKSLGSFRVNDLFTKGPTQLIERNINAGASRAEIDQLVKDLNDNCPVTGIEVRLVDAVPEVA